MQAIFSFHIVLVFVLRNSEIKGATSVGSVEQLKIFLLTIGSSSGSLSGSHYTPTPSPPQTSHPGQPLKEAGMTTGWGGGEGHRPQLKMDIFLSPNPTEINPG